MSTHVPDDIAAIAANFGRRVGEQLPDFAIQHRKMNLLIVRRIEAHELMNDLQ
jgi:hypothetical protein